MQATIVAAGDLAPTDVGHVAAADLVIAADGGASGVVRLGRRPDLVVGDLDSIGAELLERLVADGTGVERHPRDKDASDTALAVRAAVVAGASRLVLLGTTGGPRLDHAVANLLLLADPSLVGVDLRLVHGADTLRLQSGAGVVRLDGAVGDLVSLLPLGDAARGVSTVGLRWPLADAELPPGSTRGLSNEVVETPASVSLREGRLVVIEHRTTKEEEPTE